MINSNKRTDINFLISLDFKITLVCSLIESPKIQLFFCKYLVKFFTNIRSINHQYFFELFLDGVKGKQKKINKKTVLLGVMCNLFKY